MSSLICGEFVLSFHESIEEVKTEVELMVENNPKFQSTLDRINEICLDKENEKNNLFYVVHDMDEDSGDFVSIEKHTELTLTKGK
jgi:hypothetical protein